MDCRSHGEVKIKITPDKNRAALPEPCEVQLQAEAKITKVYFLGRLETATVADAEQRLREAQAIQ